MSSKFPELLTRGQAAKFLGVKPQTLAVWAVAHRYNLPLIKVGSLVRYRRSDLERFLEDGTVGAESEPSPLVRHAKDQKPRPKRPRHRDPDTQFELRGKEADRKR